MGIMHQPTPWKYNRTDKAIDDARGNLVFYAMHMEDATIADILRVVNAHDELAYVVEELAQWAPSIKLKERARDALIAIGRE